MTKPRTPQEIARVLRNHASLGVPLDPEACGRIAAELQEAAEPSLCIAHGCFYPCDKCYIAAGLTPPKPEPVCTCAPHYSFCALHPETE